MKSTPIGPGPNPKLKLKEEFCLLTPQERIHQCDCPLVGLTGSVATGKTRVAQLLREHQVAILCADTLVKEIYRQKETIEFIRSLAPHCVRKGSIHFPSLREFFFRSSQYQGKIETFLYEKIPAQFALGRSSWGPLGVLVYDVPLLFEKNLQGSVDLVVTVRCSRSQQIQRLIKRDGVGQDLAEEMVSLGMPMEKKEELSDVIVDNSGDLSHLRGEVEKLMDRYFQA